MGRTRTCAAVLIAFAAMLALAAPALAWRRPDAKQRRGLIKAGEAVPHAGSSPVHVSHIRVSTVGPWASVTLTISVGKGAPDTAGAIFKHVHGHWRLTRHSPGTDGIQCGIGMPEKDRVNLGFGPCRA